MMTAVIPTLGNDCLRDTIEDLNSGSLVPNEILVCIPEDCLHKVLDLKVSNLRIVATACRGQVAQRAVGFRSASQEYVLQLDDDMRVDEKCVENLLLALDEYGPDVAVAPSLFWSATKESFYKAPANKFLLKWYYWMLNSSNGYEPGKITRAGTNIGVDPASSARDVFDVEWLPGGCVLHRKQNLVLDSFYPFPGKAFCEDIIHSHHLRSKGVRLIVSSKAICWLECAPLGSEPWHELIRNLVLDFRARRFFVRLTSRSQLRMILYYFLSLLRFTHLKTFGRFSQNN